MSLSTQRAIARSLKKTYEEKVEKLFSLLQSEKEYYDDLEEQDDNHGIANISELLEMNIQSLSLKELNEYILALIKQIDFLCFYMCKLLEQENEQEEEDEEDEEDENE